MAQGIISSLGIGSGLDTGSIVEQLVAAERRPREARLNRSQQSLQLQLSAFGQLAAALDKLGSSSEDIANLKDGRRISVSRNDLVSASVEDGAQVGSFGVETVQKAQAHSLASTAYTDSTSTVGSGTLHITVAGNTVDVTVDSGSQSLADVRDAINTADAGVTAVIVNNGSGSQLLLSANDTGADNSIEITATDDDGNNSDTNGLSALVFTSGNENLTQTAAAQDATIEINGVSISRSSNDFENVLPGISLSLLQVESGTQFQVDVTEDSRSAEKSVSAFVEALGKLGKQIDSQTAYDASTGRSGVLQGDSTARTLQARLRDGLVTELVNSGNYRSLVEIGITTGAGGEVEFDESAFNAALEDDFEGVTDLLNKAASHFGGLIDDFGEESGLIGSRTDSLESRLESIGDRRVELERRMQQIEARITSEFAALDSLISELQNTGNFLSSQLAKLPVPGQE